MSYSGPTSARPHSMTFRLNILAGIWIAIAGSECVNAQDLSVPNGAASAGKVAAAVHDSVSDRVARQIIETTNVRSGLCLHVGSRDGRLTASIAGQSQLRVYGIENDAKLLAEARDGVWKDGLFSGVSFGSCSLERLPFDDRLADLVVVHDLDAVLREGLELSELARVTSPLGVLCVSGAGDRLALAERLGKLFSGAEIRHFDVDNANTDWTYVRKTWPKDLDQWTHSRYDATGNAVSEDKVASATSSLSWISGPFFARKTEVRSVVSAEGRIFAKILYPGLGEKGWRLVARDAFNGMHLWTRPVVDTPVIAVGDRVFAGFRGRRGNEVAVLDAETGNEIRRFTGVDTKASLLYVDGLLVAGGFKTLRCVQPETGEVLWTFDVSYPALVADSGRVFIQQKRRSTETVCLDVKTGKVIWRRDLPGQIVSCHDGILTTGGGGGIHAINAETGEPKWHYEYTAPYHHAQGTWLSNNLFIKDLIWIWESRHPSGMNPLYWVGLDAKTGSVRHRYVGNTHPRCTAEAATSNHIFYGSAEILDVTSGENHPFRFVRQACVNAVVPANGMLYSAPARCVCFPMIRGFMGFRSDKALTANSFKAPEERLVTGSARPAESKAVEDDWPMYRRDHHRSGRTAAALPDQLQPLWKTSVVQIGAAAPDEAWEHAELPVVTQPVIAAGLAYVAVPTAHRVAAYDAQDGKLAWSFHAGGVIDTPPTISHGLCLIGSTDGWIYALNATTGDQAWRRFTSPVDRRIPAYNQMASEWPVTGGILPFGDRIFVCTGRHPLIEKGITVTALVPASGEVVWTKHVTEEGLGYTNPPGAFRWGTGTDKERKAFGKQMPFGSTALAQYLVATDEEVGFGPWSFDPQTGERKPRKWDRVPGVVLQDSFAKLTKGTRRPIVFESGYSNRYYDRLGTGRMKVVDGKDRIAAVTTYKGITLTRSGSDVEWEQNIDELVYVRTLLWAGPHLYLGTEEPDSSREVIRKLAVETGEELSRLPLDVAPTFDGMSAAHGRLYVSTQDGKLLCFGVDVDDP
jgi:outer membrane protein assembly factor BamB